METHNRWSVVCRSSVSRCSACGWSKCACASACERAPCGHCTHTRSVGERPPLEPQVDDARDDIVEYPDGAPSELVREMKEPDTTSRPLPKKWPIDTPMPKRQPVSKLPINSLCQHGQQPKQRQRHPLLRPSRLPLPQHHLQHHQQNQFLRWEFFPKHPDAQHVTLE